MDLAWLQEAADKGIIDVMQIREMLEMTKRQELLDKHPYSIWENKHGIWYTYLPDKERGRKLTKRTTKKAIEDLIINYWTGELIDSAEPTVRDIFYRWADRRLEIGAISKSTHYRYRMDFERFYADFGKRKISSIDPDEIEDFLVDQIRKFDLTARGFANLKLISKGMLKYAKKKKWIHFAVEELFDDMDISDRQFRKVIREDYQEVFNDEDRILLCEYIIEHQDVQNLAILLMFLTGLRVGELVCLKHTDMDGHRIRVRRTESRYREGTKDVYAVKEYPKTKAGVRTVLIPRDYAWLVKCLTELNPECEYIFSNASGERLTTNSIRCRMYRLCGWLDIYQRSPHKARKTYGSILMDNGLDRRLITELMGHSSIAVTEAFYHYDRRTAAEKMEKISAIPELRAI